MGDLEQKIQPLKASPANPRPVLLTVLCLFSSIYFAVHSILFFVCIVYSGTINRLRNLYIPGNLYSKNQLLLIFSGGFLLNLAAFTGTLLIWSGRKSGYYILSISCVVIALCQIFKPQVAVGPSVIYFFLIVIFAVFFRRLR